MSIKKRMIAMGSAAVMMMSVMPLGASAFDYYGNVKTNKTLTKSDDIESLTLTYKYESKYSKLNASMSNEDANKYSFSGKYTYDGEVKKIKREKNNNKTWKEAVNKKYAVDDKHPGKYLWDATITGTAYLGTSKLGKLTASMGFSN